jgi:hypothetical protein
MGQGFTALIVRFKSLGKRGRKKGQGKLPNYQIRQRRAQSERAQGATVVTTVHVTSLRMPQIVHAPITMAYHRTLTWSQTSPESLSLRGLASPSSFLDSIGE